MKFLRAHPVHDAVLDIVLDGVGPGAVGAPVMDKGGFDVEEVDDGRRHRDHSPVYGSSRPCCPAALRGSGYHEASHFASTALWRRHESAHGVHRADSALRH